MYLIAWKTRQEILAGCILRCGPIRSKKWMSGHRMDECTLERQETGDSCRLRSLPLDMIQIVYVRSQDE
jgi:hypothetical protein